MIFIYGPLSLLPTLKQFKTSSSVELKPTLMVRICVHQQERRGLVRDSHRWPRKLNIELVMGSAALWRPHFDLQITFPQLSILT